MATQLLPVQLPQNVVVPTPPPPRPIGKWQDIEPMFRSIVTYLRVLQQWLQLTLNQYVTDINLFFNATATSIANVTLPTGQTTLIGSVTLNTSLTTGDLVEIAVQGTITASSSFKVIVKGHQSGKQLSGLPNSTTTSDASGNFHYDGDNPVPSAAAGDSQLDFYISQSTGNALTLVSAQLGAALHHSA